MKHRKITLPKAKRLFDITSSFCILLVLSPLVLVLLFIGLIEQFFFPSSRGPIFYREIRVSGGKPFLFTKFRIFKQDVIDAERKKKGVVHTKPLEKNSDNLTFVGKILKSIYMDELPQLGHVLSGHMTLVGPRPTNTENTEKMRGKGDYTKDIMLCGLTGPFQAVKGCKGETELQRDVDMKYIEFVSTHPGWRVVLKDIRIIARTVRTVLEAKGI